MKKTIKMLGLGGLVLVLFVMMLGQAQVALADTRPGQSQVTTLEISEADQQEALAFWTNEEMAAAQEMVMPVDYSSPSEPKFGLDVPDSFYLMAASSPAGKAEPGANKIAREAFPEDWSGMEVVYPDFSEAEESPAVQIDGTKGVFDSYILNQWKGAWKIYPHKWVGRLSFKTPTGGTSYCSATAISGNNFVTAAHCVYDTTNNFWYNSWVFVPAFRAGTAPYGKFSATACTILTAWINKTGSFNINGWTKVDLAVCSVGTNGAGKTLNQAVGWAGRAWNLGYKQHFFDMGYPFRDTNNVTITNAGKFNRTCVAESRYQATNVLGMGCDLGPGISGGPWMLGYKLHVITGYVNSVNSGFYIGQPNMYGIRFNGNNIVPLCSARGC